MRAEMDSRKSLQYSNGKISSLDKISNQDGIKFFNDE